MLDAWKISEEVLRPRATSADISGDSGIVCDNVRQLADAGFLGLGIAREFGGLEADDVTRHEYAEIVASSCGVTAFTQQQLQTGIKFITESDSNDLKASILPELARGTTLCGIAMSHLRRPGAPCVRAERADGGYIINGNIPWVTGWSMLDAFVLGAVIVDSNQQEPCGTGSDSGGSHLFAYIDCRKHRTNMVAGAPMPLVVMEASDTVEVRITDVFVSDDAVVSVRPAAELARTDMKAITAHAALPLGCARSSVRYIRELAATAGHDDLSGTALALSYELDHCRRQTLTWNCECLDHPEYAKYAVRARASAIVLAQRAAHAAITATGGKAHLKTSLPQRLLREAQFYTTAVQTVEIRSTTLDQLVSPLFGL